MQKFITDIHTHSAFSPDGVSELSDMLAAALEKGVAFYGVSEHFDFGLCPEMIEYYGGAIDTEAYFHAARHLQEDYEGVMNVLVGGEFGYPQDKSAQAQYLALCEKYKPDFIVNSVHMKDGWDYSSRKMFYTQNGDGSKTLRPKKEVYNEYFALVEESLDAPYPYDIVGHLGYVARYLTEGKKQIVYAEHAEEIDRILKKIVAKGKILEANASTYGLGQTAVTGDDILKRYYELGGRKVSYASDAHQTTSILRDREKVVALLKEIGFTYLTVPCKGEHIKVEI